MFRVFKLQIPLFIITYYLYLYKKTTYDHNNRGFTAEHNLTNASSLNSGF